MEITIILQFFFNWSFSYFWEEDFWVAMNIHNFGQKPQTPVRKHYYLLYTLVTYFLNMTLDVSLFSFQIACRSLTPLSNEVQEKVSMFCHVPFNKVSGQSDLPKINLLLIQDCSFIPYPQGNTMLYKGEYV